jgi:hypothetical protein
VRALGFKRSTAKPCHLNQLLNHNLDWNIANSANRSRTGFIGLGGRKIPANPALIISTPPMAALVRDHRRLVIWASISSGVTAASRRPMAPGVPSVPHGGGSGACARLTPRDGPGRAARATGSVNR